MISCQQGGLLSFGEPPKEIPDWCPLEDNVATKGNDENID